jgi:tetratricopeptide repeat protein
MRYGQPEATEIHENGGYSGLSVINQATASRIEKSMKTPAYVEQKTQSILPPEYETLEEADIYLRFGHDKLAEEALREAIKINPGNPQAYLTLLRICFSRKDSALFLLWRANYNLQAMKISG